MIFIKYPFHFNVKMLELGNELVRADQVKNNIALALGYSDFLLLQNGKRLHDEDVVPDNSTVHVSFCLPGGKGGFGSMLRAIGAQIEKTTNREACRDLSGRRLRDINEEQRLKKWISKEAEREAEKIKRRQARIERLKTKAPHKFFDYEYEKEISELPERIDDALNEGLQKVKQGKKRPNEDSESGKLPKKSWIAQDFSGTSSDSDSDNNSEEKKVHEQKSKSKPEMEVTEIFYCDADETLPSTSGPNNDAKIRTRMPADFSASSSDSDNNSEEFSTSEKDVNRMPTADPKEDSEENSETADDKIIYNVNDDNNVKSMIKLIDVNAATSDKSDSPVDTEMVSSDIEKNYSAPDSTTEPEAKDDSPIELLEFQSVSELEALGLDKLKSALMQRGLKCGGTLTDRAQRLWKIRGLEPHKYPKNLLAKK